MSRRAPPALLPHWLVSVRRCLLLVGTALSSLSAQDIIMSPPATPVIPSVLREAAPPPPASTPPGPPATPFQFGPFILHPSLSYGYVYADGLPSPDGRRIASEIHTVRAAVSTDLGRHWALSYNPTWVNYTARAMADSFDHAASLSGAAALQDWGFTVAESYSASTPTLVETGRQTEQETWSTSLGTTYNFSPTLQFQGSASMNERYADLAPSTRGWSGQVRASWQATRRLNLSLGPSFTYTEIADAADTYGESYTGQVGWQPLDKLSITLDGGMQYTHSRSSAGIDLSNPLLNLSLGYQPFATTSISLGLTRTVSTSYFKDQVTKDIRWNLGVSQRLFGHFYLSGSYSRYKNDYTATNELAPSDRADVVEALSARLTTRLLGRLSVSASFQQNKNDSNVAAFSFSSRQYGLELSCQF